MRVVSGFAVAFLSLLALFVTAALAGPSASVITGGKGVGSFLLGRSFAPYEKALGAPTRSQRSDSAEDARLVYYKKYGMYFFVKKGTVNGITVESPLFSTPEGLHVGSAEADVSRLLGAAQSLRAGEVVYPERGLGFTLSNGKVARIYVTDREERDVASGDLRIVPGVRVGGIQLGQPAEFVLKAWKEPSKRAPFPQREGSQLWSYEKKGAVLIVFQGKIDGIWLFSGAFRTVKDIHVGSRRDAVVAAYGNPKGREDNMESYPSIGIAFFYENGAVKQIYVKEPIR